MWHGAILSLLIVMFTHPECIKDCLVNKANQLWLMVFRYQQSLAWLIRVFGTLLPHKQPSVYLKKRADLSCMHVYMHTHTNTHIHWLWVCVCVYVGKYVWICPMYPRSPRHAQLQHWQITGSWTLLIRHLRKLCKELACMSRRAEGSARQLERVVDGLPASR